jgi:1,4-dihydroxy-2-naphthoyl-CoA hydrolase
VVSLDASLPVSPFDAHCGTELVEVTADRVVLSLPVAPHLLQPHGIVHGGVYATMAETAASFGANAWLAGDGHAVGVSNHTDFLAATGAGTLEALATPVKQGRSMQLWDVRISDDGARLVAVSRVRLMNLRDG